MVGEPSYEESVVKDTYYVESCSSCFKQLYILLLFPQNKCNYTTPKDQPYPAPDAECESDCESSDGYNELSDPALQNKRTRQPLISCSISGSKVKIMEQFMMEVQLLFTKQALAKIKAALTAKWSSQQSRYESIYRTQSKILFTSQTEIWITFRETNFLVVPTQLNCYSVQYWIHIISDLMN